MFNRSRRNKSIKDRLWNCLNGINYAIEKEQNLIYIMAFVVVVLGLAVVLKVNTYEILALVITSGITFSLELVNTAIEAVTDLAYSRENELAKISKDSAGASVFIMTVITIITVLIIFIPKIIELI